MAVPVSNRMPRSCCNPAEVGDPAPAGVDLGNNPPILPVLPTAPLLRLNDHLGLHRVGDEAGVVRPVMKLTQFLGSGHLLAAETDLGSERHPCHGVAVHNKLVMLCA